MSVVSKDRFGNAVPTWYAGYVESLADTSFLEVLSQNMSIMANLIAGLSQSRARSAYADGKWTVAEVIMHVMDSERIFAYRALRIARNDSTPLPGFDENAYTPYSLANQRSVESLLEEYLALRRSTLALFQNFTPEMLERTGTANGHLFSVEMIGIVAAGHELHHLNVLRDRYGLST